MSARQLPDVIDLLLVCTNAGMNLYGSLKYVAGVSPSPIGEDLNRMIAMTDAGASLSDALRALGELGRVPAIRLFGTTLARAYARGEPVSSVLRAQARVAREYRRQSVQGLIKSMPTKITLCGVVFFLPGILALTILPAVLLFLQSRW